MKSWAVFDDDGHCVSVITSRIAATVEAVEVTPGTKPNDIWRNPRTERVENRREGRIALPAIVRVGDDVRTAIPSGCHVLVNGERQDREIVIDTASPGRVRVQLRGRLKGEMDIEVRSWREERIAAYPSVKEQLEMMVELGFDGWRDAMLAIRAKYPK